MQQLHVTITTAGVEEEKKKPGFAVFF